MGCYSVDTSAFPFVVVNCEGSIDDAAFRVYLESLAVLLNRGTRYSVVFDATAASTPSPKQRKMQADYNREERERLKRLCACIAFVIPSPLLRGALTAILWLQPLPCEHRVCAKRADADAWVRSVKSA